MANNLHENITVYPNVYVEIYKLFVAASRPLHLQNFSDETLRYCNVMVDSGILAYNKQVCVVPVHESCLPKDFLKQLKNSY